MSDEKRSAGLPADASPKTICSSIHFDFTAHDLQAQMIKARFCLSRSTSEAIAFLCFGEVGNDG